MSSEEDIFSIEFAQAYSRALAALDGCVPDNNWPTIAVQRLEAIKLDTRKDKIRCIAHSVNYLEEYIGERECLVAKSYLLEALTTMKQLVGTKLSKEPSTSKKGFKAMIGLRRQKTSRHHEYVDVPLNPFPDFSLFLDEEKEKEPVNKATLDEFANTIKLTRETHDKAEQPQIKEELMSCVNALMARKIKMMLVVLKAMEEIMKEPELVDARKLLLDTILELEKIIGELEKTEIQT